MIPLQVCPSARRRISFAVLGSALWEGTAQAVEEVATERDPLHWTLLRRRLPVLGVRLALKHDDRVAAVLPCREIAADFGNGGGHLVPEVMSP